MSKQRITIAYGDGIGPEIMAATLRILEAAGAQLEYDVIEIGKKVYESGVSSGIEEKSWDSLFENQVFLKAPITTPQGGGYKSLNVTARKTLGLFSNVRPVTTYLPFVPSKHHMDLVIIRENEEDLYAGIEHQQTSEVVQCLKLITRPGCEKIVRYAFDYARAYGRKKVTCFSKDNIMKMTDGLFHKIFDEIGAQYPEIEKDHRIIDIGSALLADTPEAFDVIVTLNLYGDIISDIAAQVAGSVGLCGSANIGDHCAMFEAIHGSAPDIAGRNIANPSGLLNSAVMMLVHINQPEVATLIENAWKKTIEERIHTADIYRPVGNAKLVGTTEFADAIIERLGQVPTVLPQANYGASSQYEVAIYKPTYTKLDKKLVGSDIFIDHKGNPIELGNAIEGFAAPGLHLELISNRGVKVYPTGYRDGSFTSDHNRLRFLADDKEAGISYEQVLSTMQALSQAGFDVIKSENLYYFNGERGYSLAQGE